ncbi:MAG: MerR family transcriptional regulator [Dehalococcoidia bacterium]
MGYAVGRVAELAGVTVRTLHHYDEIGLLRPSGRSEAGYRRYSDADLERLQQVLYYRELGFALDEIAAILDDPDADAAAHLRRQHRLLRQRIERLSRMAAAVEHAMEAQQMGMSLTPEERLEVFGNADPSRLAPEAEERWGHTEEYREAKRRVRRYTKEDWLQIKEEADAPVRLLVAARADGLPATSEEAMGAAEAHRQQITRWFYDCTYEVHRGLAAMYVEDDRFRTHYDHYASGLADYIHDAILANAGRHGA